MMVISHSLAGVALATAMADKAETTPNPKRRYFMGAASGLFLHGLMDCLPHSHPINSYLDLASSCLIIGLALLLYRARFRLPLLSCLFGSLIADFWDLGVLRFAHISWRLFPWHWKSVHEYFDALYSNSALQTASNILVLSVILCVIFYNRQALRDIRLKAQLF
jgi:hypothetical protein